MTIGEKLKQLRVERQMTQTEVCGNFITRNMLSKIENGSATPSVPTIAFLAKQLNVETGYFFDDQPEQKSRHNEEAEKWIRQIETDPDNAHASFEGYLSLLNNTLMTDKAFYTYCISGVPDLEWLQAACLMVRNPSYKKHIEALCKRKQGNLDGAISKLNEISEEEYPEFLFGVYTDLETCYLEKEDYKKAYEYADKKLKLKHV